MYKLSEMISVSDNINYIMQMCSGITRGRALNGELYAQRLQKLIYLHLINSISADKLTSELFGQYKLNCTIKFKWIPNNKTRSQSYI